MRTLTDLRAFRAPRAALRAPRSARNALRAALSALRALRAPRSVLRAPRSALRALCSALSRYSLQAPVGGDSDLDIQQGLDDGSSEFGSLDEEGEANKKRRELDWRVTASLGRTADMPDEDTDTWAESALRSVSEDECTFQTAQSYLNRATGALIEVSINYMPSLAQRSIVKSHRILTQTH